MTKPQIYLYRAEWSKARKAAQLKEADRHRLHLETFGVDKSSLDLTNAELDKILATFRALSQPYNLNAQVDAQHQPRKRMLWWIRNNCYEDYARAIARDKFGTEEWAELPFEHLQQLHLTLKNRSNSQQNKRRDEVPESHSCINVARELQPTNENPF